MADPSPELINALFWDEVRAAREQTPGEKMLAGPRLFEMAVRIMEAGIRSQHPHASDAEVDRMIDERLALGRRLENLPLPEAFRARHGR